MNSTEALALLQQLWTDLHDVRVLWQLAVIGAGLAAAAWIGRVMRPRFATTDETLKFGLGGLQRLQFPLTALIVVLLGRAVLKYWHPVNLLNVAVPLLTALATVRIVVYALRRAFAPGGWLRTSERFIAWTVWIGCAVYITGLAPDFIHFLDEVGFDIGKEHFSVLLMLQGALAVLVTLLAALWLGRAIESRLMDASGFDLNVRVMLSKLVRALLALVAVLIALPAVGIDLTVLSVFGGALGVGLGFGLQKIASNYVSGFIILMDRSVSLGDVITVDKHSGELVKMTARYVVVRNADGTEALIPNETLVTSPVVNHTYRDRRVRVAVPLQVSRRSDLELAMRVVRDAGTRHPRALRDPAPEVLIRQFADGGIELELGIWIEDPEKGQGGLRSDLYAEIWRAFKAQGIEIAFPPRVVRVPDAAHTP